MRGQLQLALTSSLATQIVLVRTISGMILWRRSVKQALYDLEDRLSYSAAMSRISFMRRRIVVLSLWAGRTGDLAGRIETRAARTLARLRRAELPHAHGAEPSVR